MRWKIYALILLFIVPFQTVLADQIGIHAVKPDLGLIAVCLIGLRMGEAEGLAMGFLVGILMDLFSVGAVGANLISKPLLGWLSGVVGKVFLDLRFLPATGILALLSLGSGLLIGLAFQIARGDIDFLESLRWIIIPQALYDGILGTVALKLLPRSAVAKAK